MPRVLDKINQANDIKKLKQEEYKQLTDEIRRFLVDRVSKTGGHLASNLGVVELTIALHLCMEFPDDKVVWDVGHQAYVHKILTGRKDGFETLRTYEGMSGFPKRKESECDAFDTGHSSTSISVALGLCKARDLMNEHNKIVAVIGDGALSGGMAYEALNNAARLKSNLTIILNDNNMSISENVGGMANYLGKIRTNSKYKDLKTGVETALLKIPGIGSVLVDKLKRSKDSIKRLVIPGMLFEDIGITYIGPIDGHNIEQMVMAFQSATNVKEAALVHVITKKGKGYANAENNPSAFHGVDPFQIKTGEPKKTSKSPTYTSVFGEQLLALAKRNDKITAVCAAMPLGTGLSSFQKEFPERFFDVGIAEEHAVTFAAGLAAGGMKPVVAIYSTFLQRAYDQILHDVCIGCLPVVFAIDRAGIVGNDGDTHQGIFDISFLTNIPNITVVAPKNKRELQEMLTYCIDYNGPIAIRYPRGLVFEGLEEFQSPIEYGKSEIIYMEEGIALLAVGSLVATAVKVREQLKNSGYSVSLINIRFIKPFDMNLINEIIKTHKIIVTMEENVKTGGFGQSIAQYLSEYGFEQVKLVNVSIPDCFVEHGDVDLLKQNIGLDENSIVERIIKRI